MRKIRCWGHDKLKYKGEYHDMTWLSIRLTKQQALDFRRVFLRNGVNRQEFMREHIRRGVLWLEAMEGFPEAIDEVLKDPAMYEREFE